MSSNRRLAGAALLLLVPAACANPDTPAGILPGAVPLGAAVSHNIHVQGVRGGPLAPPTRTARFTAATAPDIRFETGSETLSAEALAIIDDQGAALARDAALAVTLSGFPDAPGYDGRVDRDLAARRARIVADALIDAGARPGQIRVLPQNRPSIRSFAPVPQYASAPAPAPAYDYVEASPVEPVYVAEETVVAAPPLEELVYIDAPAAEIVEPVYVEAPAPVAIEEIYVEAPAPIEVEPVYVTEEVAAPPVELVYVEPAPVPAADIVYAPAPVYDPAPTYVPPPAAPAPVAALDGGVRVEPFIIDGLSGDAARLRYSRYSVDQVETPRDLATSDVGEQGG